MRALTIATAILTLTFGLLTERQARACIPMPDASGVTDMESRRAVIWLHKDTFEIVFQNQYTGSAQDFAWVIPLPGVPTKVDQPTEKFLEELDRFTAPMIEQRSCVIPCHQGSLDAGVPLPGGGNVPPPPVTVWGSGKLGDLEYQVLSSSTSQDLINWLNARGFKMPQGLDPLVASYLQDGFTFFAAKITSQAGQKSAAVPEVRFTFDRTTTEPIYPMRISGFNRTSHLDTTIWVIADDGTYLPKGYPAVEMPEGEHTEQSYTKELELVMAQAAGRTFAVQFAGQSHNSKRQMVYYQYGSSKTTEMQELTSLSSHIVRLRARLNPNGMTEDLVLEKTAIPFDVSGWYKTPCPGGMTHEVCTDDMPGPDGGPPVLPDSGPHVNPTDPGSDSEGGCQLSPTELGGPIALPLVLLGLFLALRRRG